ncbi:Zinc finger CCCH domain-containing protein 9 [Nymphaea thermarum]|nr:Zinc finger CCCH domain-containing protein 9 [Nymphaea thermarum]
MLGVFKTEMCNKWQQSGECPYNDSGHFAHGIEELRHRVRVLSGREEESNVEVEAFTEGTFKTELCNK